MLFYDRTGLFFSEKKAIVLNIGSNIYRLWTKNKINELLAFFLHLKKGKGSCYGREKYS
jgi:hypothetical protein